MASPILPQRTYRLSQIPVGTSTEEIRQIFPLQVRDKIQFLSLASALNSGAPDKQVSTITFASEPHFLQSLPMQTGALLSTVLGDVDDKVSQIWIDKHFYGFTALNDTADESKVVEYVTKHTVWF